ncbi:hypothetical protein Tco_1189696 [Tanacetum coccineum]
MVGATNDSAVVMAHAYGSRIPLPLRLGVVTVTDHPSDAPPSIVRNESRPTAHPVNPLSHIGPPPGFAYPTAPMLGILPYYNSAQQVAQA